MEAVSNGGTVEMVLKRTKPSTEAAVPVLDKNYTVVISTEGDL